MIRPRRGRRSAYKATWKRLSWNYRRARRHVIGDVTDEDVTGSAEETRHWLEETVGIDREDEILEIGCGIGRVGRALAPHCRRWTGCDVSPYMLRHARRALSGLENVRLLEISGYDLAPVADCSVDLVYCTVVFMHLDEWDRYNYIQEAFRILRTGGRLFVDNFDLCSDEGWSVFEQHRAIPPKKRPAHISKASTSQELITYMERAGFQSINSRRRREWLQVFGARPHAPAESAL